MTNLLPGNHSEVVTTYINDIMQQLKDNPKVLPVVSTPSIDSRPGTQPSQDGHHRSPSASRRHREDSDARVSVCRREREGGGGRNKSTDFIVNESCRKMGHLCFIGSYFGDTLVGGGR